MPISDPLEHAHRVIDVVRGGMIHATSDAVAHSWARCIKQHGLDPSQARRPPVLGGVDLPTRQRRMAAVIDCARYEMTTLYQQLGDPELAVVLTDTDGVILHMVTSQEFERLAQPLGLEVGAVWSEAEVGTNGMGTCVAEAAPVVVQQADHFLSQYTGLTCCAVPISDPAGQMTAVLDVSSRSIQAQKHLLLLLGMTARMIENRLIDMRFRDAHPIQFHSRPEFVYTLHEGKLVVDEDGRVLAANHSAAMQLEMTHGELRGARLEQIFQTTLDDMLERSHRAAFHPIVTYRANAANRFFAVARLPAREENAGGAARLAIPVRARMAPPLAAPALPLAVRPRSTGGPGMPAATFGDPRLAAHLATARRVIAGGTPLLLRAETGAGKEVFARAGHASGNRADGPFVAINCASLPEALIESELFGYRAGAFTGAEKGGRRGKIVQSDGGTLFLDEIGDMPLALQSKLLRVLQEKEYEPVGSNQMLRSDVRIIAATSMDLQAAIARGAFRADLYYRLNVLPIEVPPLRQRLEDLPALCEAILGELGSQYELEAEAQQLLARHAWPGNIRELRNVLERATLLADQPRLGVADLRAALGPLSPVAGEPVRQTYREACEAFERELIAGALAEHGGNVPEAASALGLGRSTLYKKMVALGL